MCVLYYRLNFFRGDKIFGRILFLGTEHYFSEEGGGRLLWAILGACFFFAHLSVMTNFSITTHDGFNSVDPSSIKDACHILGSITSSGNRA